MAVCTRIELEKHQFERLHAFVYFFCLLCLNSKDKDFRNENV